MPTMSLTRRSLQIKLAIVACAYLAIVLGAIGMSALMIRAWDRALDERGQLRTVSGEVSDLKLAYSDQESGIRGYRLTLDDAFLEPYRSGRSLEEAMKRRIRTEADPSMHAYLDAVETAATQWQTDVAEPSIDPNTPMPDAAFGKQRFDALRIALDQLDQAVTQDLNASVDRVERAQRSTFGVLFASALVAIGGTALITVMFRRWITRPLSTIVDVSRRLATDDATPMPEFDSAELQDVGEAITSLQLSLRRERDRAVAAYEALEQSANLALHVRSELAEELGELPGGWVVGSAHDAAEGLVAGDCYDLSLLDQRRFYVIMIDVTGHGPAAALHALTAKTQLRSALRSRQLPGQALSWLSHHRRNDERAELLTAFVAIIDIDTGWCEYANGGHPPPIITNGSQTTTLETTGPLVGAFAAHWDTRRVQLEPDSSLVIYTDGVSEALGPERQRFGEDRLHELLAGGEPVLPNDLIQRVVDGVDRFRSGVTRTDDTTIVVVHRGTTVPTPEPVATLHP